MKLVHPPTRYHWALLWLMTLLAALTGSAEDVGAQSNCRVNCEHHGYAYPISLPAVAAPDVAGFLDAGPLMVEQADGLQVDVRQLASEGLFLPNRIPSDTDVLVCKNASKTATEFGFCVTKLGLSAEQRTVYDCLHANADGVAAAACVLGGKISDQNVGLLRCLGHADTRTMEELVECAGPEFLGIYAPAYECLRDHDDHGEQFYCLGSAHLHPQQAQWVRCFQENRSKPNSAILIISCGATQYLDPQAAALLGCIQRGSDTIGVAACMMAGRLTPEQQIVVGCSSSATLGAQVYAGCVGGRLTARELAKCFDRGIGRDGCFGKNNDLVKLLGSVSNAIDHGIGSRNSLRAALAIAYNDVTLGLGENNDFVRALANIESDIRNGPGENNDVRKAWNDVFGSVIPW